MTVFIGLLRAVNVGGRNLIGMALLRELCGELGLRGAATLLQSGNLVFASGARDPALLGVRIEAAIEGRFGFRPSVLLRALPEWEAVIAANPFAGRADVDPRRLVVMALAEAPGKTAQRRLLDLDLGPEEVRFGGRELYIHYPNGVGPSKLTGARIEKALATTGTARNWNTTTKLRDLAARLAAA